MVNVLVVEDNFHYSKVLINMLSSTNSKMRLFKMCTDGKEAINIIKNEKNDIDIILLDLKLPNYNGIDILKYIEDNNLIKYKNSIIVVSGEMELMIKIRNNSYLFSYIDKMYGLERVIQEINILIDKKENEKSSIEYKTYKELSKLHYNFSHVGTRYIVDTIILLYNYKEYKEIKLEKTIYPIIARKYKRTINNIKTNIINATNLMYYNCEISELDSYLNIYYDEKPTPKMVILTILNNLKYNN